MDVRVLTMRQIETDETRRRPREIRDIARVTFCPAFVASAWAEALEVRAEDVGYCAPAR
jgi:hypothetical protein